MPSCRLVIAPAAINDLRNIYRYGLRQWGKLRSEGYLAAIKSHFQLLTQQPFMGAERPELLPGIRSLPIESHTLFYRATANQVEIIRILHGRQDPHRHLR